MHNSEKMKKGGNCSDILRVFMWKKELKLSAPVNIMSSSGRNLQGGRFQNFVTIRMVEKQNELSNLAVNFLKITTIHDADFIQATVRYLMWYQSI